MQNSRKATDEIRRSGKHPGIVGAFVQNGARFPDGQRYYDLIFEALIEGGHIWPLTFLWRLDADWTLLRNQTPRVQKPPCEYVFEHIRFTSQPMEQPEPQRRLPSVFEWAKAEKMLMIATVE